MISSLVMRLIIPSMALIATARPLAVSAFPSARSGSTNLRRLSSRSARLQKAPARKCIARQSLVKSSWAPIDGINHCFAESIRPSTLVRFSTLANDDISAKVLSAPSSSAQLSSDNSEKIVLWRGESAAGYSLQFRHQELSNSIAAAFDLSGAPDLKYNGMLKYDGERELSDRELKGIEGAMEFVANADGSPISKNWLIQATERSSLIRECYEVVAKADTYEELAQLALESHALDDVLSGGDNEDATWRIRLRQYFSTSTNDKGRRYGKNVRSPIRAEKQAIQAMSELFIRFKGKVDLMNPDCGLYLFEGTKEGQIILARTIAKGPKISRIAPKTRICITNTPLEPIAAYNLCNFARVSDDSKVLDTYAGSCATLLAAASVAPNCTTVGIEIALKKFVKKEHIIEDFTSRNLKVPNAIIRGDSMDRDVREKARNAIGGQAFDCIATDPPYGVREKAGDNSSPPLVQLFEAIAEDRDAGAPLIKIGGRLTAFVPVAPGESVADGLPDDELAEKAGMKLTDTIEQPLNHQLARWLVAYTCVR